MPDSNAPELSALLALALPWALSLVLALSRAAGMMLALPSWSHSFIPRIAKGAFAIAIASAMAFLSQTPRLEGGFGLTLLAPLLMEFVFGLTIGFLFSLPLHAAKFAGQIMGVEMGLSFSAVSDPMSDGSITVMSAIVGAIALQLCFSLGFDRELLAAVIQSVEHRPLGTLGIDLHIFQDILDLGKPLFSFSLKLALPVLGTLFALKLSMAYLARLAPKLQIFSLSFVLTLLVGQWVLIHAIPSVGATLASELERSMRLIWSLSAMVPNVGQGPT